MNTTPLSISRCLALSACTALFMARNALASGFALYEASSETYALGGTVLGKAVDASANFHNPATLTDINRCTLTLGAMTEHPRAKIRVDGGRSENMDPGLFLLPSAQLAMPLGDGFAFGLGIMPEYGLGSKYSGDWTLNYNTTETTVTSVTVNPNLAWKTGRLSVGAGLRFLYFDFEQRQLPWAGAAGQYYGRMNSRLKGDNGMRDIGYQVGLKFDLTDDVSLGLVYKSRIMVNVEGDSEVSPRDVNAGTVYSAHLVNGPAETDLELPDSITGGFNWDATDAVHIGGMVGWTQWSTVKTLDFNLNGFHKPIRLEWNDTWRLGLSASVDVSSRWTAMASYVFENDCCGDQESTMLPAADRHMLSWGFVWRKSESLEIAGTYGMILMDGQDTQCRDTVSGELHRYRAHHGISHATGVTLTYRF